MASAGTDLEKIEVVCRAYEIADDGETPSFDESNRKGRARVVIVDGMLARELIVDGLDIHASDRGTTTHEWPDRLPR